MPFPRNPTGPAANLQPNEAGAYAPISPRSSDGLLVVAIRASAGGLDAFRALIPTLPVTDQMVFVLVQHLDPTHESLLVDLLSGSTAMPVSEARQGMRIAGGNIYVISPGSYLALKAGEFQTSEPVASQKVRLPFDFLLGSIASACGRRGACVVLSGTGTDGTAGLQAVKQAGGYAIVQDPKEAAYKGMPQSAVSTGEADLVLPLAKMAEALSSGWLTFERPRAPSPRSMIRKNLSRRSLNCCGSRPSMIFASTSPGRSTAASKGGW